MSFAARIPPLKGEGGRRPGGVGAQECGPLRLAIARHLPRFAREDQGVLTNHTLLVVITTLFVLPSALFAVALQPLPALVVLAGCVGGLAIVATRAPPDGLLAMPVNARRWTMCCVFALAVLVLGGEGHLFFATWDWLTRDAVLADLVRHGSLAQYRFSDADHLLRAPLGMYLFPALVGRAFDLGAAHGALLAQNTVLLGTIFYFLAKLGKGWPHLAILVLFAGVSIIGAAMRVAWSPATGASPSWLQWGLDSWHPMFQFSGTLVQFFWVPNHALPAWWLATILLLQVRGQIDVATLGVGVAAALFWSPLSIVPVAPWLVLCLLRNPRELVLSPRIWLGALAGACFLPIAVYLLLASMTIAGGSHASRDDFAFWYLLFAGIQLPVLAFLAFARTRIATEDRILVLASALTLLVLLFFRFGPNNDLVMRSSIVPLVIVAFVFGDVVVEATRRRSRLAIAGWLLVAVSAPSAAVEIGRALSTPRYAISACSLADASRTLDGGAVPTNYVASLDSIPSWLIDMRRASPVTATGAVCWPDRTPPKFFGFESIGREIR